MDVRVVSQEKQIIRKQRSRVSSQLYHLLAVVLSKFLLLGLRRE